MQLKPLLATATLVLLLAGCGHTPLTASQARVMTQAQARACLCPEPDEPSPTPRAPMTLAQATEVIRTSMQQNDYLDVDRLSVSQTGLDTFRYDAVAENPQQIFHITGDYSAETGFSHTTRVPIGTPPSDAPIRG